MKRASAIRSQNQDGTGVPDFSTASAGGGRRTRSSKVTTPDPGRPMPEIAPTETRRRIDAGEAVQEPWRERRTDDRLRRAERPAGRSRRGRAADDHTDLCGAPAAQLMRHNRPRRSVRWACVAGGDEGNRTPNPRLAKAVLCQLSYVPGSLRTVPARRGRWDLRSAVRGLVPQVGVLARAAHLGEDERPGSEADDDSEELLHGDRPVGKAVVGVGPAGFEPATSSLSATRSNQLSYGPLQRGRGYPSPRPLRAGGQSRSDSVTSMPPTRSADTL
jgi:hypothetical protein